MEDLDDYLEGELASINEMFEQFQTKDQQTKKRILTEEEELRAMEKRAKEVSRLNCAWIRAVDEATLKFIIVLALDPLSPLRARIWYQG